MRQKIYTILVFGLALLLRLTIAFSFYGTGDTGGWRSGGITGLEKIDMGMGQGTVYDGTCTALCPNWPPFTYHYLIAMRWVYLNTNYLGLPEYGYYKLLSVIADVGIVGVIYYLAKKWQLKNPLQVAALYAFHPVALHISAYHGQRDSIWILSFIISMIFVQNKRYITAAIIYAFGTAIKAPALMFLPFLYLNVGSISHKINPSHLRHIFAKRKLVFLAVFFITLVALSLPEAFQYTERIMSQVVFYRGFGGWWGFGGLIGKIGLLLSKLDIPLGDMLMSHRFTEFFHIVSKATMYLMIFVVSFSVVIRKSSLLLGALSLLMVVFVFSPIFAFQYLIWPLPFFVLLFRHHPKYFWIYSVLALYMSFNFYGFFGVSIIDEVFASLPQRLLYYRTEFIKYPMDTGIPLWIFSIFLLVKLTINKNVAFGEEDKFSQ